MSNEDLKLSVVMITYKHEEYIAKAINSILMQECSFPIELIIADDLSPDNTASIVNQIKLSHKRGDVIKYTKHKQNKGVAENFDWALKQATGKYIALCEGDDYWIDKKKLEKQVAFLEKNEDFNMCVHNTNVLKGEIIETKEWRLTTSKNVFNVKDYIYSLFFHTSSVVFRTHLIENFKLEKQILQSDMSLFLSVINDKKVFFFNEAMSVYRIHEGGVTNSSKHKSRIIAYNSQLLLLEKFDKFSNGKFKNSLSLKKRSLIYLVNHLKSSNIFTRSYNKFFYYLYKLLLKITIKL